MTNTYPTVPQWTVIAEANYPKAALRDRDEHTDGENRIAMIVAQVAGITRGTVLRATPDAVKIGTVATATFTIPDIAALASYAVKPNMAAAKRVGSFVSGRTGWHGPIGQLVIPAIDAGVLVIDGLTVVPNTTTGKPVGTVERDGTVAMPNNIHNPRILRATGKETVALSAFGNVVEGNVDASTVAVTTYLRNA